MRINAASIGNIPFTEFGQQVEELVQGGVDFFHVDIMDGHYVPNLCFPVSVISDLKQKYPHCTCEVHMMVDDPASYIDRIAAAGADYASFHIDSTPFIRRTLTQIQKQNMKAGVVINPSQRIDLLEPYIQLLDYVTLMAVEPGFAGQKFLPGSMERLRELALLRKKHNAAFQIMVDGGVAYDILPDLLRNGADMFVNGIYTIFKQKEGITAACKKFTEFVKDIPCEI